MKLRLPNKLQAALMAALASVSFTTLSSGTLSAAFFFGSQAFAEEAADNPAATIDIGDSNLDAQAAIDEEEGKGEAKEPGSAPINQAGSNGVIGSSDDFDRQSTAEASIDTENVGTADQANYTGTSADLPSNDLGFTANSYASGSSNGSVVDSPVTSFTQATAVPAVQQVQDVESTTSTTSSGTSSSTTGTAKESDASSSGSAGFGGISTPTLRLSTSSLGSTANAATSSGAAGFGGISTPTLRLSTSSLGSTANAATTSLEDAELKLVDFTAASMSAAVGWTFSDGFAGSDTGVYTSTGTVTRIDSNHEWTGVIDDNGANRTLWAGIITINVNNLPGTAGMIIQSGDGTNGGSTSAAGNRVEGLGYGTENDAKHVYGAWQNNAVWGNGKCEIDASLANYADANGNVTLGIFYYGTGTRIFLADMNDDDGGLKSKHAHKNLPIFLSTSAGVQYTNLFLFGAESSSEIGNTDMASMMKEAGAYYWKGSSSANWNAATTNWTHYGSSVAVAIGTNGGNAHTNVVFGADATNKNVTLAGATTVGALTVSGGDYTFNLNGNLTTSGITIAEGASLAYAGTGNISGALSGAGTFSLAADQKVLPSTVSLGSDWTGAVRISGSINDLDLRSTTNLYNDHSSVILDGWTGYFRNADEEISADVEIGAGGITLTNGWGANSITFTGALTGSGNINRNNNANVSPDLRFTGDVSGYTGDIVNSRDMVNSNRWGLKLTYSGSANQIKAAEIKNATGATGGITINLQAAATVVDSVITRNSGTIDINVGTTQAPITATFNKEVSASALTINSNSTATLANTANIGTLSGTGALTVAATGNTVSINGTENYSGVVNVTSGTLDLTSTVATGNLSVASGATLKFAGANQLTVGGNLTLAGNLDVSRIAYSAGTTVNLASYTGEANYAGATITGLAAGQTGTLGVDANNHLTLTFGGQPVPKEGTFHVYVLTGQSNSLGAVKGKPLAANLLAAYGPQTTIMWDGNVSGSLLGEGTDGKAWNDNDASGALAKEWFVVRPQATPGTSADLTGTPWEGLTYTKSLMGNWGGDTVMGPEFGFSYIMEQHPEWYRGAGESASADALGIIKASRDGGSNDNWIKGASLYNLLLDSLKIAVTEAQKMNYASISLDGLMYLQGESNSSDSTAAPRYAQFLIDLSGDLEDWMEQQGITGLSIEFSDNSVTGEPFTHPQTAANLLAAATSNGKVNADQNGRGFVFTKDLDNIGDNLHFRGTSQVTIGARYAYAFAVQNGINVGTVRGQDDSKNLNEAGAWWMEELPTANDIATWDISSVSTVNNIANGATLTLGGIRIEEVYAAEATDLGQGTVSINGGTLSLGADGIRLVAGNLSVSSTIEARATQTWNTVYTPDGGTQQNHLLTTSGTVDIASGATLTIAENSRWQFNVVQGNGSLVISDGVTLAMTETDLGNHAVGGSGYSDGNNGFLTGRFDLITLTGDGAISVNVNNISKAGALADKNITLSQDGKVLQILNGESTIYHVRDGVVVYNTATGITDAASIDINDMGSTGATLELATALANNVTITSSGNGGAVKIDNGVSLAATSVNAASGPVAITGSGTFVGKTSGTVASLAPADVFGTGVTLSPDWRGTVKIADTTISSGSIGIKLNDLGNASSVVEFEGVKAFLNADSYTYAPNIKLTGEGLDIDAGTSNTTYTFNGDVSGNGKLKLSLSRGSSGETYVFAGDVKNWNGEILAPTNGKTITLKFTGDADTVNAKITKTGGTLHLQVANNATFGANVTGINNLTTLAGTRVAFNGENTSISGTSSIGGTVYNGGTMTLGGTVTVNAASLSAFEVYGSVVATDFDGQDAYAGSGFRVGTDTKYYLLKSNDGSLTNNVTAYTGATKVNEGTANDIIVTIASSSSAGVYYVNSDLTYGDRMGSDTAVSIDIQEGKTLTLSGTGASTLGSALKKATGAGNVLVSAETTVAAGTTTLATGNLTVRNAQLNLGAAEGNSIDISSFSKLVLDNGVIKQTMAASTYNNVTVDATKTGKIASIDMNTGTHTLADDTTVDGTLTLANFWNAQFKIENLVGNGTLEVKGLNSNTDIGTRTASNEQMQLTIDSLSSGDKKFTGSINIDHQSGKNQNQESFTIKSGKQAVSFSSLRANVVTEATVTYTADAASTIGLVNIVTDNSTLTVNGDATTTITSLTGAGNLKKEGSGNLVISATNSYTGDVSVNSGKLELTSAVSTGNMTVVTGATLAFAGVDMLTLSGTLTLESGSRLDLARIFASPVQSAPVLFSAVGGEIVAPANGNTYILATANSIGSLDGVELANIAQGYTGSLSTQDAGGNKQLILTLTADYDGLIWNGPDGNWSNQSTDAYWHTEAAPTTPVPFTANQNVRFDSNADGKTVTLTENITAGTVEIQKGVAVKIVDSNNKTLSGTLIGAGTYVLNASDKTLPENLNVSATDWSGVVRLSGTHQNLSLSRDMQGLNSTVELKGVTGWFSEVSTGNIDTFDNDLVLTNDDTTAAVTITAGYTKERNYYKFAGKVSGDGTFEVNADATNRFIFSGDVSDWKGQFHVTKAGAKNPGAYGADGSEIVFADDAHVVNATLTRDGGTMNLVADTNTTFNKAVSGFSRLTVTDGNTATFKDVLTHSNAVSLAGTLVVDSNSATASSISGAISGGGAIVKNGTATLELGGNNTSYTGNITVSSGTLKLNSAHALGADNVSDQSTRSITIDKGGTIDLNGKDDGQYAYILHGGSLVNNGNNGTSSEHAQTTKLTLTDDSSIGGTHKFYLLASNWGDTSVDMGGKVLEKTGSNEIVMWSTNVTNGGTILISDGSLNIDRRSAQKTLSSLATNINIAKNGSDALTGNFSLAAEHTISSSVAGATMSANVGLKGATTLSADADDSLTLTGVLSNAADSTGSITKSGAGTVTLSGSNSNSYSGGTTVNAGTLVVGANGALGSGTTTVNSGGTLALTSTVTSIESALTVNSGGTLTLAGPSATVQMGGAFTLASDSTLDLSNYTFTGSETSVVLATTTGSGSIVDTGLDSVKLTFAQGFTPDDAHLEVLDGNTLVLTFGTPAPAKDLLWKGGDGTWVASTAVEDWYLDDDTQTPASFGNGDNVRFDGASSDATMTVSGSIVAGSVAVESGANVTLVTDSANTLTATGGITVAGTLALEGTNIGGELSGSGVVVGHDIPSAVNWSKSAVLGDLTLDADDWTGTVEVGGGHHEFSAPYVVLNSINQLGTADSTVRLKGVGGYFDGGTITANIELVNPDDASPAVLITAGNNKTTTFSGSISGSGELKFDKNGGAAETFKFTGDISRWNGSLTTGTQHTGPLTVELAGEQRQTVNAAIMQGGTRRALNLKVDNDATFKNTVKVSNVEIAGSEASATFMGDTQIATLAGAGTLVVDGAKTTTTIGSGSNFTGDITLRGGTLDLTSALTNVGEVNLGGSAAATLKLAGGGNALTSTSSITLGDNLTLDLSNYSSVETGGSVTLATATDGYGSSALDSVSLTGLTLEEGYKARLSVENTTDLVLTVRDESENLIWLDPAGTWTARRAWYESDKTTPASFENGDSVTIVGSDFDGGTTIRMIADASARNMTVTKDEGVTDTTVTIKDTVNQNRLAAKNLTLEGGVTLVTDTQMEVTETAQLGANTKWKLNSPKDAAISAAISSEDNTASITKQGDNTLTLTGNNSEYTGTINVTAGTLAAQGADSLGKGTVIMGERTELSLENRGAMNGGSLTLGDGSTISFLGDTELTLTGTLTLGDGVIWDLSRYGFDRPAEDQIGTATLINVDDFGGDFGTNPVITVPGIVHDAQLKYEDGSVILTYTMDAQGNLYWKGGTGTWNTDSDNRSWYPMKEGGDLTSFYNGDNVTFDDRAAISSVTLTEDITAGTVTVENGTHVTLHGDDASLTAGNIVVQGSLGTEVNVDAATVSIAGTGTWTVSGDKDRAFAGELAGTGTLAKNGSGDLELSNANSDFTGDIQLNEGSITVADADALGTGTTIVMGDGTELKGSAAVNMGGKTIEVTNSGANATVSANLDVAPGTILTFAGNGTLDVTGTTSGSGTITQSGYGVTNIGNLNDFNGTLNVDHGTLVMQSAYMGGDDTISSLSVKQGATLTFASNVADDGKVIIPLTVNTLNLLVGSYLDVSNITLGNVKLDSVTDPIPNAAVLALVTSNITYTFPHSQEQDIGGKGKTDIRMIEGVMLSGTEGLGIPENNNLRLRYGYIDGKLVVYVQTTYADGKFWNDPDADGKWENTEDPQTLSWNKTQDGPQESNTWYHSYYSNKETNVIADDAYFMKKYYDKDGNQISANIDMVGTDYGGHSSSIDFAGDIIFGKDTIYTINGYSLALSVSPNGGYDNKETTLTSSLVVDENAQVTLNAGLNAGEGNLVHVKEGANFVINATQGDHSYKDPIESVYIAYGHNAGYTEINADGFNLKSYTNAGTMKVTHTEEVLMPGYPDDPFASTLETFTNMETGVVTFSSDYLMPFPSTAEGYSPHIYNDGKVYFQSADNVGDEGVDMIDQIAVQGRGEVYTQGNGGVIFDLGVSFVGPGYPPATVEASKLELDAAFTTFNYGVAITDTTTVKAGKDAYFYGGTGVGGPGSLGEVALEDASTITFGPRVEVDYYGEPSGEVTAQSYDMGHVTAGSDSVLTVQKGATVTMDGFNAASGVPAGEIVVGSMPAGAPSDYLEAASLLIDGPAAVDTVTVLNGTATVNGNASINQIMQDDGVLTLKADSVLNGVPVSAEPDAALTGGTVTGGKLVLDGGKTLDQNAVIDVRNVGQAESGGTYTVSGGENSRIDASDLALTVNREKTLYREVVKVDDSVIISEDTSNIKSGFMASGEEFVKLFDMATGTTLTANNEAIYHASATGMMTLIGNDNYTDLQIEGGSDLSNFIGYGYLFTKDLALKTYYVRDIYTTDDRVTLSNIIDASADEKHLDGQLENVVFDKTEYNTGFSPYNGTLTVDEDNTSVDLFSVSADANAAINIIDGKTVTANAASPGMAGNLDLEGEGVYEITNRNDLGTNIALRRDEGATAGGEWDGTVRVTGTSTDLVIDNMSVGEGSDASTIEFKDWDGALDGGKHTSDGKIVLTSTQDSPTAMKLTGEDDIDYTFTNTVTGGGNISHAEGGNVAMTFTGDTAGWSGTYEQLSATDDSLTFSGGTTVNADVASGNGSMNLTYGGTVTTVASDVNVYSGGDTPTTMNVTYTGADKAVTGGITSDAQSQLTLTVGDGTNPTTATFTNTFTGTENATMAVKGGSKAVIGTKNAELLRVLGDEGSDVVVNEGSTLSLASTNPETGYSQFYSVDNEGTIEMKANGGEIKLIDTAGHTNAFNLGDVELVDAVGTATIETYGVEDKETNVNISGLVGPKSSNQVLELMNGNATGTVNYNLGNTDDTKDLNGTIAYGVNGGNDAVTNLVIQDNGNSAASAVLETRFANANDPAEANIVVDTHNGNVAHVLGLSSDANSFTNGKDMVVSGSEGGNKTLEITGDEEYNYAGSLGKNLDITYSGDGKQTIAGGVANFEGKVTVNNGSNAAGVLEILNASSVSITELTIGTNNTLDVGTGTATASDSVVALGGPTIEGSGSASKFNGNLTLGSGSTYDVSTAGGTGGLNLTGALTIEEGAQLSGSDISTLMGLEIGDIYDLAFGVTNVNFGEGVITQENQIDASQYFTNLYPGEFYICYTGLNGSEGSAGSNVGTVYLYKATPEPTTSTLSLLALAALAARRRRK